MKAPLTERVVAGRKRVDANENTVGHNVRHLDAYYDEDGSLVGMFRLGPDEGAALLAALTLGKDVLRDQKRSAERSGAPVAGLLWLEDRYRREVEAVRTVHATVADSSDVDDAGYPDVIVIDDDCDDDIAV